MNPLVVSHLTLRRMIGIAGFILPIVLWANEQRDSISNYYYGSMRDYFVGSMVAIGAFLAAYNGYDWRDAVAGRIAGAAALLVALCPHQHPQYGFMHFVGAVVFLLTLAYFSLYLFTRHDGVSITREKSNRNKIYALCGLLILVGVGGTVAGVAFGKSIFWWEALAVIAFGTSWLVKGEIILADQD